MLKVVFIPPSALVPVESIVPELSVMLLPAIIALPLAPILHVPPPFFVKFKAAAVDQFWLIHVSVFPVATVIMLVPAVPLFQIKVPAGLTETSAFTVILPTVVAANVIVAALLKVTSEPDAHAVVPFVVAAEFVFQVEPVHVPEVPQ
jgi:hypothetical protein